MAPPAVVVLVWNQFGPYHMDRCEALAIALRGKLRVCGVEVAGRSREYEWAPTCGGTAFEKRTLFPDIELERIPPLRRFRRLLKEIMAIPGPKYVFLNNYNQLEIFLCAAVLRLLADKVFLMMVSKFDDKPRLVWHEILKPLVLWPYQGALVGGPRHESYLRFLGFRRRPVLWGYNTVGLDRMVELSEREPAPEGADFHQRYFVAVARFVEKKDLATAIAAYARYRVLAGAAARQFHICGSGPLEADIRTEIANLCLEGVVLQGFLQREGIARALSGGLAMIIPSVEEQWGLVVNEALAFNLPILATDQVGARDLLIRSGVNGYIFEPGNVDGLAHLMYRVGRDEAEWRRLVEGSRRLCARADTARFADAVEALVRQA